MGLFIFHKFRHEHLDNVADALQKDKKLKVKVLSVDRDSERISLSIKDTLPGPWVDLGEKVSKGSVLRGM